MRSTWTFAAALPLAALVASGCAAETEAPASADELELAGAEELDEASQPLTNSPETNAEPWIVYLSFPDFDSGCTASVLTAHWLLTAAHCVEDLANGTLTNVSVRARWADGAYRDVYSGKARTYKHKFYGGTLYDIEDDIAIVRLTGAAGVDLSVTGKAKLFGYSSPWASSLASDRTFSIIGYGMSGTGCDFADFKKRIATGFVMDKEPLDVLKVKSSYGSKHACDGDSGAPWLLTRNGVRSIVAVHSGRYPDLPFALLKQQASLLPPKRDWMYETSKSTSLVLSCGTECTEHPYNPQPPPGPACPSGQHCCAPGPNDTCAQCLPNSLACP